MGDGKITFKGGCLLVIVAALLLAITAFYPIAVALFKLGTAPKPVEISEANFIKLLQSHQFEPHTLTVGELDANGKISHFVTGYYKNPHPPGADIRFETAWEDGSGTALSARIKEAGVDHATRHPNQPLSSTLIRLSAFALFLVVVWVLLRGRSPTWFQQADRT